MRRTRPIPLADTRAIPVSAWTDHPHPRSARARRRTLWMAGLCTLVLAGGATAAALTFDTAGSSPRVGSPARALADARAFLGAYVEPSGQVVRRDQGGDTVSEGQAYGMLIAQAIGDHLAFNRIWDWTRSHLQQPNGLLAFHASPSGSIEDATPASDADVLAAWALSRATGSGAASHHEQARRMSSAILDGETVARGGQLILAAGPWATGSPASLDPSYWNPNGFDALARFTGDPRWRRLRASATQLTAELTGDGRELPPDWAKLADGAVSGEPAPGGAAPQVRYGLDAQRLVVAMAVSCNAADRRLAARWWRLLAPGSRSTAIALSPAGAVIDAQPHALPSIAAAAAATAAGDTGAADRLLAQARRAQRSYPTYYGGAWLALGELMLSTDRLGGCAGQGGNG